MPVDIHLSDNKRYIVYKMTEPLQMKELLEAYNQEKVLRDSSPYTVHSIVDMSELKRIPPNWLVAKAGPGFTHPRSGEILIVGVSKGLRLLLDVIMKIVRFERIRFFATRQEADAHMTKLLERDNPAPAA